MKMKRVAAIVLAATMAMGSTLTVCADEPLGSGGTTGQGENEGHVDKELINVVLPTMPEEGSPFDYVTDPERLIQETKGARYEDYTFPDAGDDTGVYFHVGEKEFANTSETLKVINKSSCDMAITLSAKATASEGGKDLALAMGDDQVNGTTPLYLGLKVGAATVQAVSTTEASVTKTISGTPTNFATQYTDGGYKYVAKEDAEHWRALEFSLTGKVNNGTVEADTTAPTVEVTWSFDKATGAADTTDEVDFEEIGEPGIISISDFNKADPKNVVIKFSLGKGPDAVDATGVSLYRGTERLSVATAAYSVDMASKTVTISSTAGFLNSATADMPIYIVLTKGSQTLKELKGTIRVKSDYDPAEIISISEFSPAAPKDVVIKFSLGEGPKAVDADGVVLYRGTERLSVAEAAYSVDMNNKTVTISSTAGFLNSATADMPIYVALTKGGKEVQTLTGTIKIIK